MSAIALLLSWRFGFGRRDPPGAVRRPMGRESNAHAMPGGGEGIRRTPASSMTWPTEDGWGLAAGRGDFPHPRVAPREIRRPGPGRDGRRTGGPEAPAI